MGLLLFSIITAILIHVRVGSWNCNLPGPVPVPCPLLHCQQLWPHSCSGLKMFTLHQCWGSKYIVFVSGSRNLPHLNPSPSLFAQLPNRYIIDFEKKKKFLWISVTKLIKGVTISWQWHNWYCPFKKILASGPVSSLRLDPDPYRYNTNPKQCITCL